MANQKNPYGSFPKLPYTPGTGATKTMPFTPGMGGKAKPMPYRPKRPMSPVTKAARSINSIDTRDVFEKAFESPVMTKPRKR